MKCPLCEKLGKKSKLYQPGGTFTTCMGMPPPYYDENGDYHFHETNLSRQNYHCSNGHSYMRKFRSGCPSDNCNHKAIDKIIELIP